MSAPALTMHAWLEHSLPLDLHHTDAAQPIGSGRFMPANRRDIDPDLFCGIEQGCIGLNGNFLTIDVQSDFICHKFS
jgi:hypothetical protein